MDRKKGSGRYRHVGPRNWKTEVKSSVKKKVKADSRVVPPPEGDSTDAEMEIEMTQSTIKSANHHGSASELHANTYETQKILQSSTSCPTVSNTDIADPDLTDAEENLAPVDEESAKKPNITTVDKIDDPDSTNTAKSRAIPQPEGDSTDEEMEKELMSQTTLKISAIPGSAIELHADTSETRKILQSSTSRPTVSHTTIADPDLTDAEDTEVAEKSTCNGGIIMEVQIAKASRSNCNAAIGSIINMQIEEIADSVNESATSDGDAIMDASTVEADTALHASPSLINHEVVIRRSQDPLNNNIIIEEIDLMENIQVPDNPEPEHGEKSVVDNPLDTSTPLGSPAISEIIQNMESDLSFSNIITPSSSMMINSPINNINNMTGELTSSDETINTENTKKKRKTTKKTDVGRKRKVHKSDWIDNKRKNLKNRGLKYTSRNGKTVSEKRLKDACDDLCRLKCKDKITEDIRKRLFHSFWALGDRVRQWQFLTQWLRRITKRRITTEGPSKRKFTIQYNLPTNIESTDEEKKVPVCRKMFLNTFDIGQGVLRTAMRKISEGDGLVVEDDERGRHGHHRKVITEEIINSICSHVKALSPVEAHYTRKSSSKLYLDGDLTMKKMFELYKEWEPELYPHKAQTLRQYTDTVNEHFNIEFHRPKKDQCDECVSYNNLQKPVSEEDQEKYDTHIRNKELARSLKNEDKTAAINSPNTTVTAAFDFQKVFSAPHAETSILYYKRKLNVLNFTMFEMGQKIGRCYMWHEGVAKRGANDVASCVFDFISNQAEKGITEFYLYSDNCAGQNRNRIVFAMYMYASNKFKVNITHRFFEKGHTQNENDSVHALIERRAKSKVIYTPEQWYTLVRWAKEETPYIVKEMTTREFFDFKTLLPGKNWSTNEQAQKVLWTKVRDLKVLSSEPNVLQYKTDFDETEYHRLHVLRSQSRLRQNTRRANTRRPNTRRPNPQDQDTEDVPREDFDPPQAYSGPLPIPHDKLVDLKYLCDHNIIPSQYHDFFNAFHPGLEGPTITDDEE